MARWARFYRREFERPAGHRRKDRHGRAHKISSGIHPKPQGARRALAQDQDQAAHTQGTPSSNCVREDRLLRAQPLGVAKYCLLSSSGSSAIQEFRIQFMLNMSETFVKSASLIQWTEQFVRAFEAASKSQQKLVRLDRRRDSRSPRWAECPDGVPRLILNRRENLKMTKTTKAMLAGGACGGLIAGSGGAVKASSLPPSLETGLS